MPEPIDYLVCDELIDKIDEFMRSVVANLNSAELAYVSTQLEDVNDNIFYDLTHP